MDQSEHEAEIKARAEALNAAIVAANAAGLHVNLGITACGGPVSYATVRVTAVELPFSARLAKG